MQLIAEGYQILSQVGGLSNDELHEVKDTDMLLDLCIREKETIIIINRKAPN